MYNVSESFNEAIAQAGRELTAKITIEETTIIETDCIVSINYQHTISDDDDFAIGTVQSAMITVELFDNGIEIKRKDEIIPEIGVKIGDGYEFVPLGIFDIDEIEKDEGRIKITAYDRMLKLEKEYTNCLIYPSNIENIVKDICLESGIRTGDVLIQNQQFANSVIDQKPKLGNITCRQALAYVVQLIGGYATFDKRGKLNIRTYWQGGLGIYPKSYFKFKRGKDFVPIDVWIAEKGNDELHHVGGGETSYTIKNNPFLLDSGIAEETLNRIYAEYMNFAYYPYTLEWQGNPALDPGDGVCIHTTGGEANDSIIASIQLTYNGGLKSTLSAFDSRNAERVVEGNLNVEQKTNEKIEEVKESIKKEVTKEIINNMPEIEVEVINTNVIKADTIEATYAQCRYAIVEFLETNFDDIDPNKSYVAKRKFHRVWKDNWYCIEADISPNEYENYTDPEGTKLYWVSITGEDAFKYKTYQSPLTISKDKRPEELTDEEFEDLYTIKVRKTLAEYIKLSIGFPTDGTSSTGVPEILLGTGTGEGDRGKLKIRKNTDGACITYIGIEDELERGVVIKDDNIYIQKGDSLTQMYQIAVVDELSQAAQLADDTIIFVKAGE